MTTLELRSSLAQKAYARTAAYDAAISNWFADTRTPRRRTIALSADAGQAMRYGENPHQTAAFYRSPANASASPRRGKCRASNSPTTTSTIQTQPSNAWRSSIPRERPACVIVKHANPCGVAEGASLLEAYRKALRCDPVSAFGGIVALNAGSTRKRRERS